MLENLSANKKETIKKFVEEAFEFNQTHNLFVRKNQNEIYKKDVEDCLCLLNEIKKNENIADLGTGGGFPGILLAITFPKNKITLIESSQKKCYFLKKIKHNLKLDNTEIVNEKLSQGNTLETYDVITARAFAKTQKILEITKENLKNGGRYLLLKGKKTTIQEEIKCLEQNQYTFKIKEVKSKVNERNILEIKKLTNFE